jgi:hypothetical protein
MSTNGIIPALAAAQRGFSELYQRGVFKPCERFVCCDRDSEDRVQEGLAFCWEWYRGKTLLGQQPDTALAVHAARLRMVDRSRRFASRDRSRWGEDAYERQGRGIELRRLDEVRDDDEDDERREDPSLGLARLGVNNPESNVVSALDLASWCDTLASADRELLAMRAAGHGLEEIGKATGRSVANVFRRARQLGFELADRADLDPDGCRGRSGRGRANDDRRVRPTAARRTRA